MNTNLDGRLLTEKELSTWLGVSLPTLQRMRSKGSGEAGMGVGGLSNTPGVGAPTH